MTEKDAKKLFAVMTVAYPNYKIADIDFTAKIWADLLGEYSYEQANMALKAYITSNASGFAPDIGQMVSMLHTLFVPQKLNATEAWGLVSEAIKRSGYYSVEEFSNLPIDVQRAVGTPGQLKQWAIDEHFNENVASSNFMRVYSDVVNASKNLSKMPVNAQKVFEKVNETSEIAQIAQKYSRTDKVSSENKKLTDSQNTSSKKVNCTLSGEDIDSMISKMFT